MDTSDNETGFLLERWQGNNFEDVFTLEPWTTNYTDTGLQPATAHTYWVRAVNDDGESEFVGPVPAITLAAPSGKLKDPLKINFGRVQVGKSATRPLTLTNTSRDQSLRVTLGSVSAPFERVSGAVSQLLGAKGRGTVSLLFRPTQAGKVTRTLTLTSSDPNLPSVQVTLLGIGATRR